MAVKIRMTRIGRRHRPFFRINAVDQRAPRNGRILEKLGHYDPIEKDKEKQIVLNAERVKYWLDNGAIPSDTVSQLLLRLGIKHKYAEEKNAKNEKAKAIAKAKGKFFTKAQKIAAEKAVENAKAEAEQKVKEAEEKTAAEAKAKEEQAKAEAEAKEQAETKPEAKEQEQEKDKEQPEIETKAPEQEQQQETKQKTEPKAQEENNQTETDKKDESQTADENAATEDTEKSDEN